MNTKAALALTAALILIQGCSSMSQQECAISDWHAVGFEDGARGMPSENVGQYRKACSRHGVVPDLAAYRAGREEGLLEFCRPQRGFDLGSRGGSYNGVCPAQLNAAFTDAFNTGKRLYELRTAVQNTSRLMEQKKREIAALTEQEKEIETALVGREATAEERLQMLVELRAIPERRMQLEQEISELGHERAMHEQALADYESTLYDYN